MFYYCVAANQTCYSFAKHTFNVTDACVCVFESDINNCSFSSKVL